MVNAGRLEGLPGPVSGPRTRSQALRRRQRLVGAWPRPARARMSTGDVGVDAFYNVTPALRAERQRQHRLRRDRGGRAARQPDAVPAVLRGEARLLSRGLELLRFRTRCPTKPSCPSSRDASVATTRGAPQRDRPRDEAHRPQPGAFDVGFLHVRTADSRRRSAWRGLFRRRVCGGGRSSSHTSGALYTRRSARLPGDTDRHTAGLDFGLSTSQFRGDQNLEFSGFYLWTSSPENADDTAGYGFARFAYPNDPLAREHCRPASCSRATIPAVGFVERRGYQRSSARALEWSPRPRSNPSLDSRSGSSRLDCHPTTCKPAAHARAGVDAPRRSTSHDGGRYQLRRDAHIRAARGGLRDLRRHRPAGGRRL